MQQAIKVLNITLSLKQINLTVRFPCSVCFTIKCGNSAIDGRAQHQLINGIAKMQDKISLQIQVQYSNHSYQDKIATLMVTMVSSNGRITAGSVDIDITRHGEIIDNHSQKEYSINKCPDRLAKIVIHKSIEFVRDAQKYRNITRSNRVNSFTNLSHRKVFTTTHNQANKKYSNISHFASPVAKLNISSDNKNKTFRSIKYNDNDQRQEQQCYITKKKSEKNIVSQLNVSSNEDLEHVNVALYQPKHSNRSKFDKIQNNSPMHSVYGYRNDHIKQNNRGYEQNIMQLENQIVTLKESNEKYKVKLSLIQAQLIQKQQGLQAKNISIKRLQCQLSQISENLQQIELKLSTTQKKLSYKQKSSNQQLQKMSDKYHKSEQQRLGVIYSLNDKIKQIEEIQKNYQQSLRQKDRVLIEQKNRYSKMIDEYKKQLNNKLQQIEQLETHKRQATNSLNKHKQHINKLQITQQQLQAELTAKNQQIQRLNVTKQKNNKNIQIINVYRNQQKLLKNKLNQLTQQVNQKQHLVKQLRNVNSKLNDDNNKKQSMCKDIRSQCNMAMLRITSLSKQNQNLRSDVEQLSRRCGEYQAKFLHMKNQIDNIRIKKQHQGNQNKKIIMKYQQQISILQKQKQKVSMIAKGNQNTANNIQEKYINLTYQLEKVNQQIVILNEQLFNYKAQSNKKSAQNQDLHSYLQKQQERTKQLQYKEHQLRKQVAHKNDKIYHLTNKLSDLQNRCESIETQSKKSEQMLIQKNDRLQKDLHQVINELQKQRHNNQINMAELRNTQKDKEILQKQMERAQQKTIFDGQIDKKLRDQINNLHNTLLTYKNSLKQITQQKQSIQTHYSKLKKDYQQQLNNYNLNMSNKLQQKQKIRIAIHSICQQICRNTIIKQSITHTAYFYELELDSMIADALRKKNQNLISLHNKVAFLSETNQYLQQQLKTHIQNNSNTIHQLTKQLTMSQQSLKIRITEQTQQKQTLLQTIQTLQQANFTLLTQKQRITRQKDQIEQYIRKLENDINDVQLKNKGYTNQIEELNRSLVKLESSPNNIKNNYSPSANRYSELLAQSKVSSNSSESPARIKLISSQKSHIALQQKIRSLQWQLMQTKSTLDSQSSQNRHLKTSQLKLQNKVKHLNEKISAQQQKLAIINHQNIEKNKQIQQLTSQINSLKRNNQQLHFNKQKLLQNIEQCQHRYASLTTQYKNLQQKYSNFINTQSNTNQQHIQIVQKLKKQLFAQKQCLQQIKSELQLRDYLIVQKQQQIANLQTKQQQKQHQILAYKQQIVVLEQCNTNNNTKIIQLTSQLQISQKQSQKLKQKHHKQKQKNQSLTHDSNQNQLLHNIIRNKQHQLSRLKDQNLLINQKYQTLKDSHKKQIQQLKKQNSLSANQIEQLKKVNRSKEQEIEKSSYDLKISKQKYQEIYQRKINQLMVELERQQYERNGVVLQYQNYREKAQKQIDGLKKTLRINDSYRQNSTNQKKFHRNNQNQTFQNQYKRLRYSSGMRPTYQQSNYQIRKY